MIAWFNQCAPVAVTEDTFVLEAKDSFIRRTVALRYTEHIKTALRDLLDAEFEVIVVDEDGRRKYEASVNDGGYVDGEKYTFERFVVGNSNRFAHAAAVAVANGNRVNYNPLFIHGNSGLGKTHLLHAVRHHIAVHNPSANIVYVKGEDFTNQLIDAIQRGKNVEFRSKYRSANIFLMDDVQFIAGKEATQEEFFHTYNTLFEAGQQIILTSDRHPNEIARLEDRLLTRFSSGLIVDVKPPDYETRMAIIHSKARDLGFEIPEDAAQYIAENMSSNIRQLEGAVTRIMAYKSLLLEDNLSQNSVVRIIKDLIKEKDRAVTADIIVDETAKYFGLDPKVLKGKSREKRVNYARQISMYLIRSITALSLSEIGAVFYRDHTTVMNALGNVETQMSSTQYSQQLRDIEANILAVNN
jgi:chromosomal replication initiator protein